MTATWDAAAKNANISLSGAGLIATDGTSINDNHSGRSDSVIGSGAKIYFEAPITGGGLYSDSVNVGLANASHAFTDGNYVGQTLNSLGWFPTLGVYRNATQIATPGNFAVADVIGWAVHGGNKAWPRLPNGSFAGDPVSGTGGIDIGAMGDVYPAYNLKGGAVVTANFGATTFAHTPPSGFTSFSSPQGTTMPTSRFLRAPVATRAVTGVTTVGGSSTTTVSIMPDGTIRFNDRNGTVWVVQAPANYTKDFKNRIKANSKMTDDENALYALVDALIART